MKNFSIGYFDRRNKDLLFAVRLPLSAGSYSYNEDNYNMTVNKNIGTIANRGWEISLDGDIVKKGDWYWNLGVDATFLKNKIIKLLRYAQLHRGTFTLRFLYLSL